MIVVVAGCGIGGLTAALSLHEVGIDVHMFEQARELGEVGVGINMLPHAMRELAALGLLPALDKVGIRTRELIYTNRFGQVVWREPRGTSAGYDVPQLSIHRGKLHAVLLRAVFERIGSSAVHTGCSIVGFEERRNRLVARFERRASRECFDVPADALLGCDGIHSAVRAILYPNEGPPVWNGVMLWRGATDWPIYKDGQTMVIAGGNEAKFVFYPIHADPDRSQRRLTNWAVMGRAGIASQPPPHREDWNRRGNLSDVLPFVRDRFRLDFVDPAAIIGATGTFYEYPNCDRDPLPRWSFGRTTLVGDAAHPMYPMGSNGASQAILDARAVVRHLSSVGSVVDGLCAYDAERRPATTELILSNRAGGPERVIDVVEARAPDGFENIDDVATFAERRDIVKGYAQLAGFAREQGYT
jgi:5-methylphenazine-1-carboxylate 1-monooxygenase